MRLTALSFAVFLTVSSCCQAFQLQESTSSRVPTTTTTTTQLAAATSISIERSTQREVGNFQNWAVQCGVQAENGFSLVQGEVNGNEDWSAATATGGAPGTRVLFVPQEMILSSAKVAQEYQGYVEPAFQFLEKKGLQHLYQQFYLWLKVLVEYERGTESPWYPWMASLPRKWDTAVSMDDFCILCLPPFIKYLASVERIQLKNFRAALDQIDIVSPETKANGDLAKFAYNIVFTRSWGKGDAEHQLVPVADMLNHGHPANVQIQYDEMGNCNVVMADNLAPGQDLHLSYGQPTNPSRFLATFGFIEDQAPATFCKIIALNPSQELKDIGYDTQRMLFYAADGAITQEVWDVVLYSMFERKPELEQDKRAFYQAHMTGDEGTKGAIHRKYLQQTCDTLRKHVDKTLDELAKLAKKTESASEKEHPRLPLIKRHNDMVTSTFLKVQNQLNYIAQQQG